MTELVRHRIAPLDEHVLLQLGAEHGAVIHHGDEWRVATGRVIGRRLTTLRTASLDASRLFEEFTLSGDPGPEGSGLVSFVTTPFEPNSAFELKVWEASILQTPSGTWLTAPAGTSLPELIAMPDEIPTVIDQTFVPSPDEYANTVARAVGRIRKGALTKVVLARSVRGSTDRPLRPSTIAERLAFREPGSTLYAIPLPDGRSFIGASPELLLSLRGGVVASHPLAGTITRTGSQESIDDANWLLGSHKNQYEHRLVVEHIVRHLTPLCDAIRADREPSIVSLSSMDHLGTWIDGKLPTDTRLGAFDLLAAIHPTPAVAGVPSDTAIGAIRELEPAERGHYAGAVGWTDAEGNGEFWVGIRGIMIGSNDFEAWAGAGIVADSDPMAEREETAAKMAAILVGLS
jgi:isochorismate synthase